MMAGNETQILDLGMLDKAVLDDVLMKTGAQSVKPGSSTPITQITQNPVIPETQQQKVSVTVKQNDVVELDKGQQEKLSELLKGFEDIKDSEETTSEKTGEDGSENTVSPATSVYAAAAAYLIEQGALPSLKDVENIKDAEDFAKAVREEIIASRYYDLNDDQKMYLETLKSGVKHEEAAPVISMISDLNKVTKDDINNSAELREALIKLDLQNQGWDEQRIERQVDRILKAHDDIEEANLSYENLKQSQKNRLEEIQLKAQRDEESVIAAEEKQAKDLKNAIYSMDNFLGVVKIDGATKDKIYNAMVTAVDEVEGVAINALVKDRMTDPIDFEKRLYATYVITNGFKDLGRLQKAAESNAAKNLRQAVESSGVIRTGSGAGMTNNTLEIPEIVSIG